MEKPILPKLNLRTGSWATRGELKIKSSGFDVVAGFFIILAGMTGAHATEENAPESMVAEAPTVPVAPGQISSIAKGTARILQRGQFKDFNACYNNRWKANPNKRDGRVRILYGNLSKRYAGDPRTVARHFIEDAHTVFGMKTDMADFKTLRVAQTARHYHVRLQQTYDGVPVRGAVVLVHTNRDGQVSMVQNDYRQSLRVENRRRITRPAAVKIALVDLERHVGAMRLIAPEKTQVIAVPAGDRHLLSRK